MSARFSDANLPDGLRGIFERSAVSLTIADYCATDVPIVGVNDAFCAMSGYGFDEVLGRNCRFLQPDGGAGPVRERMRAFLSDPDADDGRFVIANQRKDGSAFLNLVYMSKIARAGEVCLVLGSQFAIDQEKIGQSDFYDRALKEDLRQLNLLTDGQEWAVLGSFEALASSHSIIARTLIE